MGPRMGAEAPSHPKPENQKITACGECLEERQAAPHNPGLLGEGLRPQGLPAPEGPLAQGVARLSWVFGQLGNSSKH